VRNGYPESLNELKYTVTIAVRAKKLKFFNYTDKNLPDGNDHLHYRLNFDLDKNFITA
jgi:hypothetical protein